MAYKVLQNFTNGDGSFKIGDKFEGQDDVKALLDAKLIEPMDEVKEDKEVEKPKKSKKVE